MYRIRCYFFIYVEGCARFVERLAALHQLDHEDSELLVAGGSDGHRHTHYLRPGQLDLGNKIFL